jgi:hypothetical protein
MPNYDATHFDPPAAVAQVMLRNPHSGAMVSDVLLLVDTGADITCCLVLPSSNSACHGWLANGTN